MQKICGYIKGVYPYLNLTDEDIVQVAKRFGDISDYDLKKKVVLYFQRKIIDALKRGDYSSFNDYLQQFVVGANIRENVKKLEEVMGVVTSFGYGLNSDVLNYLISNNERFRSLLKAIVDELKDKELKIEEVVGNEMLQNVVEVYCIGENISIDEEDKIDDLHDGLLVDSTRQYLKEIGSIPRLSREEEKELTQLYYATRDENIKNRIVEANLRLVASIAKRYQNRGVPFLDLNVAGALGLMRAVEKFDPSKGYRLSTYVTWDIRQSIQREIAGDNAIHMPVQFKEDLGRYIIKKNQIGMMIGHDASIEEMAEYTDYTPEVIAEFERMAVPVGSLQQTMGENDDLKLEDLIMDEQSSDLESEVINKMIKGGLLEMISGMLKPKEVFVLEKRFGLVDGICYTRDKVAKMMYEAGLVKRPLTKERIGQIEKRALMKLRYPGNARKLERFR